jgi:hypothetical protein
MKNIETDCVKCQKTIDSYLHKKKHHAGSNVDPVFQITSNTRKHENKKKWILH